MVANQQKSQIIIKREPISPEFKGILCFQNSSRAFSPILQNILISLGVFPYLREINHKI